MKSGDNQSWARDIRRQVLELIVILAALVVAAGGYDFWSHVSNERVRDEINDYHLIANSHYLRAMEELRNLQGHHGSLQQMPSADPAARRAESGLLLGVVQHKVLHYLVDEKINLGLALEQRYDNPHFRALRRKIEEQVLSLSEVYTAYEMNAADDMDLLGITDKLLVSLDQIVRLHGIRREKRLEQLHAKEHFEGNAFYVLMFLLLLVAMLVARRGFVSIERIIQTQVKAEEEIKHQAHYDNLTGLPNRSLALDRLEQMISEAERSNTRIAVLFIDLDYFKKVNDMLGHINADHLLVEVAKRISHSVRAGDTVGRLGGDEFIVLGGGISSVEEVMTIAENLNKSINENFVLEGKELILTSSIGISVFPDDGRDRLELIRKADSAMYHSKESGRNTYSYFDESMNLNVTRQLALEEQIHGALDRGEFSVVYQQKVDLASNRIVGAEALLRWNNDSLGQVPPDEFIPIAEQTGLIVPIGHFVLTEALRATRSWREQLMPDFRIAVNLSPRQFRDPDLVNNISRSLHQSNVPSKDLELEITEGVLLSEYVHIDQALEDLGKLGVVIAMDDFGTGYSSLSYLRKYPFGVIKIDRSFIQDIERNSMSLKLNHAAIAMAHALNINVVAEGVETHSQFSVLQGLQCDVAQGYYFGRPMPAEQFTELLRAQVGESRPDAVVDISELQGKSTKISRSYKD